MSNPRGLEALIARRDAMQQEMNAISSLLVGINYAIEVLNGAPAHASKAKKETFARQRKDRERDEELAKDVGMTLPPDPMDEQMLDPEPDDGKPPKKASMKVMNALLNLQETRTPTTRAQLAAYSEMHVNNVTYHLETLITKGYVYEHKDGKTFYYIPLKKANGIDIPMAGRTVKREDGVTIAPPAHAGFIGKSEALI